MKFLRHFFLWMEGKRKRNLYTLNDVSGNPSFSVFLRSPALTEKPTFLFLCTAPSLFTRHLSLSLSLPAFLYRSHHLPSSHHPPNSLVFPVLSLHLTSPIPSSYFLLTHSHYTSHSSSSPWASDSPFSYSCPRFTPAPPPPPLFPHASFSHPLPSSLSIRRNYLAFVNSGMVS